MEDLEDVSAIAPLGSNVLIKRKEREGKTAGGLLMPKKAEAERYEGEVIAVGPGDRNSWSGSPEPMASSPGKTVAFAKGWARNDFKVAGQEYSVMLDSSVLFAFDGESPTLENIQMPPGKVLVRLLEKQTQTEGGLLLSKGAQKQSKFVGEVVSVGLDKVNARGQTIPVGIEAGEMIQFKASDKVDVEIGEDEYVVVDSSACLMKWRT